MKNDIKKCYIEEHNPKMETKEIRIEWLDSFFDIKTRIGVKKCYIETDLKVGSIYEFTFEDYNDCDSYDYVVLKKEENIYYIAEYYNGFYKYKENCLGNGWIKCNVEQELGINLVKWQTTKLPIINCKLCDQFNFRIATINSEGIICFTHEWNKYHSNNRFKFCPECGRKLTEKDFI